MPTQLYQVDAFTDQPFKGNPAAVCLLDSPAQTAWMQALAGEMNLSETAFVSPAANGWNLRWFTPTQEVDLCGHATLASALVLFTQYPQLREQPLQFTTRSGALIARQVDGDIELDFPVMDCQPYAIDDTVPIALGFTPCDAVHSNTYCLFQAADAATIRTASPDMAALRNMIMPEVIITAKSDDPNFDFISRFFAPQLGVPEDPVTGSAHCLLAPFWADKLGKTAFTAYQASERGGTLHLQLEGERVKIRGSGVIIFEGHLRI